MKLSPFFISLVVLLTLPHDVASDEVEKIVPETIPEELIAQTPNAAFGPRGTVTCELFELIIKDDDDNDGVPYLAMNVWNNFDLHDCPNDWLSQVDKSHYYVGGPRWRTVDFFTVQTDDENGNLVLPQKGDNSSDIMMTMDKVPTEVPPNLGLPMVIAATVNMVPISVLEEKLGLSNITSVDDLPDQVRQMLLSGGSKKSEEEEGAEGYKITKVDRKFNTLSRLEAGKPIYTLRDGRSGGCTYAMKYRSAESNPGMADGEAVLMSLGSLYTNLPDHMTYEVVTYETDQYIVDTNNLQYVLTDEFYNSFDLFHCNNTNEATAPDNVEEGYDSSDATAADPFSKVTTAGLLLTLTFAGFQLVVIIIVV